MATVQSVLYDARALLAEYNEDGVIIPSSETATMDTNGLRFINMAMQEIYDNTRHFMTHKILRKPTPNLLGDGNYFDIKEFIGDPIETIGVLGAKSYYFEVDNDSIVKVQEEVAGEWVDLHTITATNITEVTPYKGLIIASDASNLIRLVFTGETYYRFSNVALWSFPFKLVNIPTYRPWVQYELPANFGELDKIVSEFPNREYQIDSDYKWEGYNKLFLSYYFTGEIRVIYSPIPTQLTSFTDTLIVNNPKAIQFIVYYVAAKLALEENPNIANYFEQKSNELKFEATKGQPAQEQRISDVYFRG
jgi:hypothetical protein